jgi:hypothetical protein
LIDGIVPAAVGSELDQVRFEWLHDPKQPGKPKKIPRIVAKSLVGNPRERARAMLPSAFELWMSLLDPDRAPPMRAMFTPVLEEFAEKFARSVGFVMA